MWALKNGDLDEVKDYVAKVSERATSGGGGMERRLREPLGAGLAGAGRGRKAAGVEAAPGRGRRGEADGEPP